MKRQSKVKTSQQTSSRNKQAQNIIDMFVASSNSSCRVNMNDGDQGSTIEARDSLLSSSSSSSSSRSSTTRRKNWCVAVDVGAWLVEIFKV